MPKFNDSKFSEVLTSSALAVTSAPSVEALPTDLIPLLMEFFSSLLSNCNKPATGPGGVSSAEVANKIKVSNKLQQLKVKRMMFRFYEKAGKPRSVAETAWATTMHAGTNTDEGDLIQAIGDARQDDAAVPNFDML